MANSTSWGQRPGGPRRIDLLPRQLVEQRVVRRQRTGVGAGFLVLLVLLGRWYVLESRELGRAQDQADQERAGGRRAARPAGPAPAPGHPGIPDRGLRAAAGLGLQARDPLLQRDARHLRDRARRRVADLDGGHLQRDRDHARRRGDGHHGPADRGHDPCGHPGQPGRRLAGGGHHLRGAGLEHIDVGGFLRALARGPKKGGQQVYLNPYFTTSQKADENGQQLVTFSATVDVSSAAYSGRFQPAGTVTP